MWPALVGLTIGVLLVGLILPATIERNDGSVAERSSRQVAPADSDGVEIGAGGDRKVGGAAGDVPAGTSDRGESTPSDEPTPDDRTEKPSATAGAATTGRGAGATEVGVSRGEIHVGFLVLKVGSLAPVGVEVAGVDPEQQRAFIRGYVDEYNEAGGFHGRTVEPVFREFEVLSTEDHRAACLELTEDKKVFAVVGLSGGYAPTAVLCITEEHQTPLLYIGDTLPTEFQRRSEGRLFTIFQHGNRAMFNVAREAHDLGRLDGAVVGLVGDDRSDPGATTMRDGLVPGLARVGVEPAKTVHLAAEPNGAASQIPVAVSQMRAAGVNTVFLMTGTLNATNFVQTAQSQGWRPRYVTADWASMYTDSPVQNMPESFEGALSITISRWGDATAGVPPPPVEKRCREIYERRTGRRMAEYGSNQWGLTVNGCALVDLLAAGLRNAGPELTRGAYGTGLQHSGEIPVTQWRGGAFAPGKFDLADYMRANVFRYSCRCWTPATDFRRTRH